MVVVAAVVPVLVVLLRLLVVVGVAPADLADVKDEPVIASPLDQPLRCRALRSVPLTCAGPAA
jgi:hypothetical protein